MAGGNGGSAWSWVNRVFPGLSCPFGIADALGAVCGITLNVLLDLSRPP